MVYPMSDQAAAEPIAVIGIGCRLPGGVTDPSSLWQLLEDGRDAIVPVPQERWDIAAHYSPKSQQAGRMNAREGGFLDRVDGFDAAFFGISGRIAEQMDPQQRLLLQVAWEALEDAGVPPSDLAGSRTGVFMGACSQDYGNLQMSAAEIDGAGAHTATGTFMSIVANRLSYTFDLLGPSMTIDTACSSSLVAVHLAVQSLLSGESSLALAGGVNLMLTPQFGIALSQASMLSPQGRSKAFAAAADGYVRGEGAGVVLLKPLSAAQRDGDRVYAVILGSAVNQDGRTQGITVPNSAAQEENFRAALTAAGLAGGEVGYVEAHGTGTPVGDPLEAEALGRVLTDGRAEQTTAYIGSIKTNIGHLEAAAGIAGLLKAVLAVKHRRIPASLHFDAPNPNIDFDRWRIEVPTGSRAWPEHLQRAVASVNSFGFGGTNANVVVSEAPPSRPVPPVPSRGMPAVLTLSARSERALIELAERYIGLLERDAPDLDALSANIALRRSHHPHRVAVLARDSAEAVSKLREFASGNATPGVFTETVRASGRGKIAFLFNGQGPQWFAMGRTLIESSPVFAAKIAECDEIASKYLGWSIWEALRAPDEQSSLVHRTYCLQPTMFAVQVALAELWGSWGVRPDGVVGHSMGEIAAAHVSGGLDLDSALKVICNRARIQDHADPSGGMMFVAMPKAEALELCDRHDELWLSAENSSRACTLSGRLPLLRQLEEELKQQGVFARVLRVNCACHSSDMDPLRAELFADLGEVTGRLTTIDLYSTVTGGPIDGQELSTRYWWRNFRQPVLFEPAIRAMLADGYDTFVELSPHPVLVNSVKEILDDTGDDAVVVSSLARKTDDWETFLSAFATLVSAGCRTDWSRRFSGPVAAMDLPTYPWQEQPYWNESEASQRARVDAQSHPMLRRIDAARPTWEIKWDDHRLSWAREHDVLGSVIVPGAAYVEAALVAAREVAETDCALEYVEFERACVLDPDERQVTRLEIDPEAGTFELHHRPIRKVAWVRAARGRFFSATGLPRETVDLDAIRARSRAVHSALDVYGSFREKGYVYGPAFCGISTLYVGERETLAKVDVPRTVRKSVGDYLFHPAVLDACFQSAILHPREDKPGKLLPFSFLPTQIEQARVYGEVRLPVWCHSVAHKHDAGGLYVDVVVTDDHGVVLATYRGLRGKAVWQAETHEPDQVGSHLYTLNWESAGVTAAALGTRVLRLRPDELVARQNSVLTPFAAYLDPHGSDAAFRAGVRDLCAQYVWQALAAFGVPLAEGARFSLAHCVGLRQGLWQAFERHLGFLVADGVLEAIGDRYEVRRAIVNDPELTWAALCSAHPERIWELLLVRETGGQLHRILTGDVDPLTVLFPEGSGAHIAPIYETSPISRLANATAREAIRSLIEQGDSRRTLRVLEVGAGTGGLTASVLPVLPADRCEYTFTDVSQVFLQSACERFAEFDFLRYQTLDLENDLAAQGFAPASVDIILAANVVHATSDLRATLKRLRALLTPEGVLVLVEATPDNRWLELTFGLTTGWWSFRDLARRPDGPLLSAPEWETALRDSGYHDVLTLTGPDSAVPAEQTVAIGRAPARPDDDATAPNEQAGDWLILASGPDLADELAARIIDRGGRAVVVPQGMGHAEEWDQLLSTVQPTGIIVLLAPGPALAEGTAADIDEAALRSSRTVTDLIQALTRAAPAVWPRLFLVTRGAHAFRNPTPRPTGGCVWGLSLVAGLELPQSRCTVIDLDGDPDAGEADAVYAQLWRQDGEREFALRGGEPFVRRVVPVPLDALHAPLPARELSATTSFRLTTATPGSLDNLAYVACARRTPGAGEVQIRVTATGLNFLDVMLALGQVPTLDSAREHLFGAECSGVVTEVGQGVAGLAIGDPVVAMSSAQGLLAGHVVLDAELVVPRPEALTDEQAAGLPIAFLTASIALDKLARTRPGERVLIHSAAGGTGLAAVQIARMLGAEVLATAGTEEKRALLRALGVQHVFDSRSTGFADGVLAATDGRGVDVVLGASGAGMAARSLSCLAAYGRFVEIGKRDLMGDQKLGLRPFLRNLAYLSLDLRQMIVDRPAEVRTELVRLLDAFAAGALRPLPYRVYDAGQATAAFRQLAGGKNLGKIVIAANHEDLPVTKTRPAGEAFPGTWLITGGLGGVGMSMAESLANGGARHLVLVGRRGVPDDQTAQRIDRLRAGGIEVVVDSVDVTSRDQVKALLDRIADRLPPLRGVLHSVMVLDDALLAGMTEQRLQRVLRPKILGAWHLHELTRDLPLEAFVLFSSATSFVGNVGQANYAAANAFLDHFAAALRAEGRPALAVNWGAVSDAGYVAGNEEVRRLVAETGMGEFSAEQAFEALRSLLGGAPPQMAVLPMDWAAFFRHHGLEPAQRPRYAAVGATTDGRASVTVTASSLRQQIEALTDAELEVALTDRLRSRVISVLGVPPDALDDTMPLMDYLDSLLAVEISSWIQRDVGVKVTIMELMKGPSVRQLVDQLVDQLRRRRGTETAAVVA
ncbi:type I polyketide synthase [Micromonospora inyonensis]|uniref:Acyl transferase domain-containing protein n=1 Tax=Micromonospora inyonensis TaxID=47866 RepID=A0A1C6RIP7_9ACTN|nr:type I polyketide synthase [Micromonospora inyonensis]SCL17020.1 Acyl transferase domain-containing protein [Micromonospora inyonensis]